MKYSKLYIITSFLLLVSLIGCKKNIDITNTTNNTNTTDIPILLDNYNPIVIDVTSSVFGTVVNEVGELVEGATVTLGTQTTTTSPFGTFRFLNMAMNKKGTFVKIEKDGYFDGGRRFFPQGTATNFVRIELLKKEFNQSFESSTGGISTFQNNGKIIFEPNSIRNESGGVYTGQVNVALKWLDPVAVKTLDQLPGALQGVNLDGEEQVLETFGMVAVELQGSNGEPLNINYDNTAEIHMPIPDSILAGAPDEIPLWSFNYEYGVWAEDGKALLQNGFYIGEVGHFSFWNCDFPRDLIQFEMVVINEVTLEPRSDLKVEITLENNSGTGRNSGFGYTDSNGKTGGAIPANEVMTFTFYDNCYGEYFSGQYGPFTDDVDLGMIAIPFPNKIVVMGELVNCDNQPVNDGFISFRLGGRVVYHLIDSSPFEYTLPTCDNISSLYMTLGDFTTNQQSDAFVLVEEDSIHIGNVLACGTPLEDFAKVRVGTFYTFLLPYTDGEIVNGETFINFNDPISQNKFELKIEGITAGTYSVLGGASHFGIMSSQTVYNFTTGGVWDEVVISEYGPNMGDIVAGYYFKSQIAVVNPFPLYPNPDVRVDFRIIRDW